MEDACSNETSHADGSGLPTGEIATGCENSTHVTDHVMDISDGEFYFEVCLLLVTIVVGLLANITAIVVIAVTKSMHTGTFLMLSNLCLNGLVLAAVCMPLHVTSVIQGQWTMGDIMCQVFNMKFFSLLKIQMEIIIIIIVVVIVF